MATKSKDPRDQAEIDRLIKLLEQQRDAALQGENPVIDDQENTGKDD